MLIEHIRVETRDEEPTTVVTIMWYTNSVEVSNGWGTATESFHHCEDARDHAKNVIADYESQGYVIRYM